MLNPSNTLRHNKELARIFRQMADCYRCLGPEQRFRAIAYNNASKTLSSMGEPVDAYGHDVKKLDQLKAVSESIASKILEYLDTGTIKAFEELKQKIPFELLELMDIGGIGPATLHLLHDTLKVNSRKEIIDAIEQGKLHEVKGFGKKKIENLLKVLKINKDEKFQFILHQTTYTYYHFIKGMVFVYLIVGALNNIGLLALGKEHAILVGFLTAIMTIIPYLGIFISANLPVTVA